MGASVSASHCDIVFLACFRWRSAVFDKWLCDIDYNDGKNNSGASATTQSAKAKSGVPAVGRPTGSSVPGASDKTSDKPSDIEKKEKERIANLERFKPAMFFDSFCWLRNGIKISLGYKFKEEPYNGKCVKEINQAERFYSLSDDTVVYMY